MFLLAPFPTSRVTIVQHVLNADMILLMTKCSSGSTAWETGQLLAQCCRACCIRLSDSGTCLCLRRLKRPFCMVSQHILCWGSPSRRSEVAQSYETEKPSRPELTQRQPKVSGGTRRSSESTEGPEPSRPELTQRQPKVSGGTRRSSESTEGPEKHLKVF